MKNLFPLVFLFSFTVIANAQTIPYSGPNGDVFLGPNAGSASPGTGDTAVGNTAGYSLAVPPSGTGNQGDSFFGFNAGLNCTVCRESTFIGYNAGYTYSSNGSGVEDGVNTFVGSQSGYLETGASNTYLGQKSGLNMANSSDTDNVMVGTHSGAAWTSGYQNIFVGRVADLQPSANESGNQNVAVGYHTLNGAGSKSGNVAVGYTALNAITTANYDVGVGYSAGYNLTTGTNNMLLGFQAGFSLTTQSNNTLIGNTAALYNTGSNNVAIGQAALYGTSGSSTGSGDVAIGPYAGTSVTTAQQDLFIGGYAGKLVTVEPGDTLIGYDTGYNLTNGSGQNTFLGANAGLAANASSGFNTFIGSGSGYQVSSGYNNTFVGQNAGQDCTTCNNVATLGYQASVGAGTTGSVQLGQGRVTQNNSIAFSGMTFMDNQGNAYFNTIHIGATPSGTGTAGLSITIHVNGTSGACTETFTSGILTSTTCS